MKVLFINSYYHPTYGGGVEVSLKILAESVKSRGVEAIVLATGPDKGLSCKEVDGVKVYTAGIKNIYWKSPQKKNKYLRLIWHLKDMYNASMKSYVSEVIKKERPDLISCHNLSGWSVAIWDEIAAHKIPIVQELNDFYLLCPNVNMFKGGKDCEKQCTLCKMMRSRHAHCSQSVSAAVGVSKFISDKFNDTSYFPNATKHVIHVARNIPAIQRKTSHSGGETMRFGYIGTLSEIKGVGWLISSFKSLDIDAKLIIAGTGNIAYEADMKDLAKSDPRIEFAGYVKPADFYPNISVLIVPSKWEEPLGMVAAEACAYDVPVIATKKGGLPELVKDGVNGILCDASDEESISNAIMKIYNDQKLYDTLRSNARESVSSMLSTEKTTNQYLEIYKALT